MKNNALYSKNLISGNDKLMLIALKVYKEEVSNLKLWADFFLVCMCVHVCADVCAIICVQLQYVWVQVRVYRCVWWYM